jgi:hypothetical protein
MSATQSSDPFSIFDSVPSPTSSEAPPATLNPFDPLSSSAAADEKKSSSASSGLDLMARISGWGAENHHASPPPSSSPCVDPSTAPLVAAPTMNTNVMGGHKGATIDISDEVVAQAHAEFEATKDILDKYEHTTSSS